MLEVQNLTKSFGAHRAIENISFTVKERSIVGFLGPNGAGKSTTMNIITGYLSATSGTATIGGHEILQEPQRAKAKIGYLPENPPLYPEMTVKAYLNFVAGLKKVRTDRAAHLLDICERTGIGDVYGRIIKNLSKGYRQRVGLAQALIGSPELIILDEPASGLDPKQLVEMRTLIRSLGESHTVILSSHLLQEVQAVCDRVLVIHKGHLVADDSTQALSQAGLHSGELTALIQGDKAKVLALLAELKAVKAVQCLGLREEPEVYEYALTPQPGTDMRHALFFALARRDFPLLGLKAGSSALEQVFLQLTAGAQEAAIPPPDEQVS